MALALLLSPRLPVHPLTGESYLRLEYPDREFQIEIWGYERSSVTYDPVRRMLSEPGWVAGDFHAVLKLRDVEFTINAGKIDFDQRQGSVSILPKEGDTVRIGREDRVITAGEVHIDTNTSLFTGDGEVTASFLDHTVTSERLETDVAESRARFTGNVRVHFMLTEQTVTAPSVESGMMRSFNPDFEFIDILTDEIEIDFSQESGEFRISDELDILTNDVVLNAGSLTGDYLKQSFVLGGGVEIESLGSVLRCDTASIDIPAGKSVFSGGVVVKDRTGSIVMDCERAVVGVDAEEKAFFRSDRGRLRFRLDQ